MNSMFHDNRDDNNGSAHGGDRPRRRLLQRPLARRRTGHGYRWGTPWKISLMKWSMWTRIKKLSLCKITICMSSSMQGPGKNRRDDLQHPHRFLNKKKKKNNSNQVLTRFGPQHCYFVHAQCFLLPLPQSFGRGHRCYRFPLDHLLLTKNCRI